MTPERTHRLDHEPPPAVAQRGWRFHHVGIPSDVVRDGERYLAQFGLHVCGFRTSPYGVEWMRFDADSLLPELIRAVPRSAPVELIWFRRDDDDDVPSR